MRLPSKLSTRSINPYPRETPPLVLTQIGARRRRKKFTCFWVLFQLKILDFRGLGKNPPLVLTHLETRGGIFPRIWVDFARFFKNKSDPPTARRRRIFLGNMVYIQGKIGTFLCYPKDNKDPLISGFSRKNKSDPPDFSESGIFKISRTPS